MTRYAPTVLVGLGGSGVKVLRWIRHVQTRHHADPLKDLLVYRGIDFDLNSNSGEPPGPLLSEEFRFFDPTQIADCVGNLRAELRGAPDKPPRRPFAEIAEWYPDVEGRSIRYAQVEAVGARQWRPLGRVGFYQYDTEIMERVLGGLTELEERCTTTGEMRPASVCIITSIAGGTGSGILLDVAANVRKKRPDVGVRLVLLLPEFFEHVEFTSKVLANAYATLTEVAHFKNQRVPFTARYPRLPPIDERFQNALFQRVYLVGPYLGQRRAFSAPDRAFSHVADLLHVFLTKELRSDAASYQINDDTDQNGDAAASDEEGPLHVFSGFAAAALPLLTYDDLAVRWAASFADHWSASSERRDIFATVEPPPSFETFRRLEEYIEASASPSEAERHVTIENFAGVLDQFIRKQRPEGGKWTPELLQEFTRKIGDFIGAGGSDAPQFLKQPVETFRAAFGLKLAELLRKHDLTPFAVASELRSIADRLRRQDSVEQSAAQEHLADFHEWLGGMDIALLAEPLVEVRIELLRQKIQQWQTRFGRDLGVAWFAYGIRAAAVRELDDTVKTVEESWTGGQELVTALQQATAHRSTLNERARERLEVASSRIRPAAEILELEMKRFDRQPERMKALSRAMLEHVRHRIATANRSRDYHEAAAGLLEDLKELFLRELQLGGRIEAGVQTRFRYLSPESTYDDDVIRRAVLSAGSRIFRPGRIDSKQRIRSGRLLVPNSFAGSNAVAKRLSQLCSSLLGAEMGDVNAESAEENRVLILIEDLFHSAEELTGIYDYYNDYMRQRRELFHIRADIPSKFGSLITTLDAPGSRFCGNPGCTYDLKGTPRTEIICPGCGAPIRNRCGNVCRLDDLTVRPDRTAAIARGQCPVCEQALRTYWWLCPRHGRQSVDGVQCADCVRERRPKPATRPAVANVFVCPGCTRRGNARPFRATGELAAMLRGEWRGEASSAYERLDRALIQAKGCPQCGVVLAPLCAAAGPPHLLRKKGHRWSCELHVQPLHACGVCGFVVAEHEYFCRRCETSLADCRFCTTAHGVRVADGPEATCPRCRLPRRVPFGVSFAPDEHPADVFCSNLFGCPVGADLFRTTYPRGTRGCAICESNELTLLEVRTRAMHVDACTFCRTLFERRHGHRPTVARPSPAGVCCLCGQLFSATSSLATAPNSFEVALKIASALLVSRNDATAFGVLFDSLAPAERHRIPSHVRDFALRVQRPAVRAVVHPRLEGLLEHYGRQFGCQTSGAAAIRPSEGGDDEPAAAPEADEVETVEEVLSRERVSGLQTNEDFERWVAAVVRLDIDYDRFDAALGRSSGDTNDCATDHRLQELRDHARALYRELTREH